MPSDIFNTVVLHPRDLRGHTSEAPAAKRKVIKAFVQRVTWTFVVKEEFRPTRTSSIVDSLWRLKI